MPGDRSAFECQSHFCHMLHRIDFNESPIDSQFTDTNGVYATGVTGRGVDHSACEPSDEQ